MAVKTKEKITIRLKKGVIGCTKEQRATVVGLGLRNLNQVSTLENSPSVRGMIKKIIHLLDIVSET